MPPSSIRVTIDGREVEISRARFGLFLELEQILFDMSEGVRLENSGQVVKCIKEYIDASTNREYSIGGRPWIDVLSLFSEVRILNSLLADIPLLESGGYKEKDSSPWDYPGRATIVWVHLIAFHYGWSLAEIRSLWPEEAAAFVQEIVTEEQLAKEWEHSLASVAHPRDKRGKDLYKPLRRPSWMTRRPRKQKLLRKTIPVGTIIDISGVNVEDLDD